MRLMFDGIIHSLQARGGITTYTNNLLRSFIEVDPKLEISILVHHPLLQEIILPPNIHRIFVKEKSLIRKWKAKIAQKNSQIFHSSYYTHSDTSQGPQVVTVYDLIYELMPEYFPRTTETNEFLTQKKTSITKADAIICISETSKADLKRIYDLDDKKSMSSLLGLTARYSIQESAEPVLKSRMLVHALSTKTLQNLFQRLVSGGSLKNISSR